MKGAVLFEGSSFSPISINNVVKRGILVSSPYCCLSPLVHQKVECFSSHFHTVSCSLPPPSQDQSPSAHAPIRMLFVDDAALASHTQEGLQRLVNRLAHACKEFGLTISLTKTNVVGQDVREMPSISVGDYTLEVFEEITHLGSTISSNLFIRLKSASSSGKQLLPYQDCPEE